MYVPVLLFESSMSTVTLLTLFPPINSANLPRIAFSFSVYDYFSFFTDARELWLLKRGQEKKAKGKKEKGT